MTTVQFTKEQLFADLNKDGITANAETITKAKNGDGDAMVIIGVEYDTKKQQYDKAMAWYRLAADKNNAAAHNNIGLLYHNGFGVPKDNLLALEWFLKAAVQNNEFAWWNIGDLFEKGHGVPANKYKALEWYNKWGENSSEAKRLTSIFNKLKQKDKNKSMEQLVMETAKIAWPGRRFIREITLTREINTLKQQMNKMEEESDAKDSRIHALQEENQALRLTSERQQQELDAKQESVNQYKQKEEQNNTDSYNNDINYDTPDKEDNDDNNDLNYDSDDQIKNRSKVALT